MPYYSNALRFQQKSIGPTKDSALRARAVWAVSLASSSTSSSGRGASTATNRATLHDNDAMEVDNVQIVAAPATIILPTLPTAIPFPPTPHSLLRSTLDNSSIKEGASLNLDDSCGKENSTLPLRPRKRTRTTALLPNHKSTRASSIPRATRSASSPPSAKRPRTSPTSPEPSAKKPENVQSLFMQALLAAPKPLTTKEPELSLDSPSLLDHLKSPFIQASLPTATVDPKLISSLAPIPPPFFRHKRPTAGEVKILIHLYRSILYGIEFRFPDPFKTPDVPPQPRTPSPFDLEDSRLAEQLQGYLTSHGITGDILTVDTEKISREALEEHQWAVYIRNLDKMDIYELDQVVVPSTLDPSLHPHLHTSANAAVLSYPNLVATLIMRYRQHPNRHRGRSVRRVLRQDGGTRPGSPLIESTVHHE